VLAALVSASPGGNAVDDRAADVLTADDGSRAYRLAGHVSALGSVGAVVVLALALAALCWWRTKDPALTALCVLAPACAALVQWVLKQVVQRRAPGPQVPASALSFPSGHATGAWALAAAATIVAATAWRPGWSRRVVVAVVVAGAVAVSVARVVAGDHYATDVMAGAVLGVAVTLVLAALLDRLRTPGDRGPRRDPAPRRGGRSRSR
jgi:undecaprenyl-diphosphatase